MSCKLALALLTIAVSHSATLVALSMAEEKTPASAIIQVDAENGLALRNIRPDEDPANSPISKARRELAEAEARVEALKREIEQLENSRSKVAEIKGQLETLPDGALTDIKAWIDNQLIARASESSKPLWRIYEQTHIYPAEIELEALKKRFGLGHPLIAPMTKKLEMLRATMQKMKEKQSTE